MATSKSSHIPARIAKRARLNRTTEAASSKPASPKKPTTKTLTKLFVPDTNVLMHDATCLLRFEEHDVYIPMVTLGELDSHKQGMTEVSRNVRQVMRFMNEILNMYPDLDIEDGIPLKDWSHGAATGRLFFQTKQIPIPSTLESMLPSDVADNQILGVVRYLSEKQPKRQVILVSKDINIRIKARAIGIPTEDYFNDKVLEDSDLLWTGATELPSDFWETHAKGLESWQDGGFVFYKIAGPLCKALVPGQFVWQNASNSLQARVIEKKGNTITLRTVRDHTHKSNEVWGITARNPEQNFALNALLDPDIDIVTLLGQAGTGKTLLALAAGLHQVLERKIYSEIIMTRVTVPVGEDIGFLPGTEEEKMTPWMGALEDNLDVLNKHGDDVGDWGRAATLDLVRSRIKIKSLNFMRGRTFINKFLIIDEAQNLTSKQVKILITRAGPGTKIVVLGNISQIDTPYLTEGSSGLTFLVDRLKGWKHYGHVTHVRGERSRLASYAEEML